MMKDDTHYASESHLEHGSLIVATTLLLNVLINQGQDNRKKLRLTERFAHEEKFTKRLTISNEI